MYKAKLVSIILILILSKLAQGQDTAKDKECYDRLVKSGIALMKSKDFGKAINQFWVAYNCNYEPGNDSLQLLIKASVKQLETAKEVAEKNERRAINSERKTSMAIEQALKEKEAKEEALAKARESGKRAEAALLTSLANEAIRAGQREKALAAAYSSICMSEAEMQPAAWFAFGKAIAAGPLDVPISHPDQIHAIYNLANPQKLLAVATETVYLLNQEDKPVLELKPKHGPIKGIAISDDGKLFSTWGAKSLAIWDEQGGTTLETPFFETEIMDACFTKNNEMLLIGLRGGMLVSVNIGEQKQKILQPSGACIYDVQVSQRNNYMLTRSADGLVKTWDFSGNLLGTIGSGDVYVYDVVFCTDEEYLITVGARGIVKRWQVNGTFKEEVFRHDAPAKKVITLTNEGSFVTIAGNSFGIYSNSNTQPIISYTSNIKGIVRNNMGDKLLVFYEDNSAKLYNANGVLIWATNELESTCNGATFCPKDNSVLLSLENQTALLLDESGRTIMEVDSPIPARFSSDGQHIITTSPESNHIFLTAHPSHVFKKFQNDESILRKDVNDLITEHGLEYIGQILK